MVDSEFVAVGAETQARLTDLGVMPKPGGEGEQRSPIIGRQARCATVEMRGREMKGWLRVDAESVSTKRALEPWAMQSVAFARALPPKEKK